jgi:glycoprotein-N-acetylgalactosamine 3-beta-galactosyltransferase
MLKYVFFSKKFKKITFICIFGVSLVILVNLNKEKLYELAENLEFTLKRHFGGANQEDRSASFENNNKNRKIRIFCIILTNVQNLKTKARAVSKTWASECDDHRFITILSNDTTTKRMDVDKDGLKLLKPEDLLVDQYDLLTNKVYLTLKDVYKNYGNYDFYLKTDDDTYIFMSHLRKYLKTQMNNMRLFYYGHKFYSFASYNSGGAGYVLSNDVLRSLVNKLNASFDYCPNSGVEDMDVGACLRKLNIYPKHAIDSSGKKIFHPFDVGYHFKDCLFFFQVTFLFYLN